MELNENSRFTLVARRKNESQCFYQFDVPWERLVEEVVTPYETGEMFFIDGAPMKATDVDQLKILLNDGNLEPVLMDFLRRMRTAGPETQKLFTAKYDTYLDGITREKCRDVTSQVIRAYRTEIKPKLRDRLPEKETLMAGLRFLAELMSAWNSQHH